MMKLYSMSENSREVRVDEKIIFLRSFIYSLGRSSLRKRSNIRIPIQTINREPISESILKVGNILPSFKPKPMARKNYFHKTVQPLFEKGNPSLKVSKAPKRALPKLQHRPKLGKYVGDLSDSEKKKQVILNEVRQPDTRLYHSSGQVHYKPKQASLLKEYGVIAPLILDREILKISCIDLEVFVDYRDNKNVSTGLRFKDEKEINKVIKVLGEQAGMKITKGDLVIDVKIPEGFRVHGNFGNKFTPANFVMVREQFY